MSSASRAKPRITTRGRARPLPGRRQGIRRQTPSSWWAGMGRKAGCEGVVMPGDASRGERRRTRSRPAVGRRRRSLSRSPWRRRPARCAPRPELAGRVAGVGFDAVACPRLPLRGPGDALLNPMKAIYVGASTLALLAFPMSYRAWVGCAGDDGDIETTEDPSVDASSADERTSGTPGVEATGPGYSVIYGRAQDPSPQLTASALANAPSASAPPAPPVEGETDASKLDSRPT